jgi:hypothetical protein
MDSFGFDPIARVATHAILEVMLTLTIGAVILHAPWALALSIVILLAVAGFARKGDR